MKKKKKGRWGTERKPNSSSYYVLQKSQPSFLSAEWDNQALKKNNSLLHKNLHYLSVKSLLREMLRRERSGAYFSLSLYTYQGPHLSRGDRDASDRRATGFAMWIPHLVPLVLSETKEFICKTLK